MLEKINNMAKISENMIPDINADWGLDASNNLPYSGEAVQEFIKRTLKHEKVDNAIFSVIFVEDEEIHAMNRDYRGVDRVTDVISFAFEDNNDLVYNEIRMLGDIYICIPPGIHSISSGNSGPTSPSVSGLSQEPDKIEILNFDSLK